MGADFDHIVVGAGSAGCVVARRLVDAGRRVLLVEAGGRDDNPAIHEVATMWTLGRTEIDYAYATEPQVHAGGATVYWPKGKVLGGSTAINGMVHVRGDRMDYDSWGHGWSYPEVLPYFKRSEDHEDGESAFHGAGGPLPVTRNHAPMPLSSAWLEACLESGLPLNSDHNADKCAGAGYIQHTIRDGRRVTAWRAYMEPIRDNPLLTVMTDAVVVGLVFDGDRCTGIEVAKQGLIRAHHDVVLSAGTIGSAQVLLCSGIGPADDLTALGIPVRADLPGVGANLHDHPAVPLVWESAHPVTSGRGWEVQFFADDLQALMSAVSLGVRGYQRPEHAYTVMAGMLRPASRGRMWLRSADPTQAPALDPGYLTESSDLDALVTAVELCRDIASSPALTGLGLTEWAPGSALAIRDYVRRSLVSFHHQVGTCRMGTDQYAVVDPELRVHGIENLRVIDASVMPTVPSGNTNAPTVMVAERGADQLLVS